MRRATVIALLQSALAELEAGNVEEVRTLISTALHGQAVAPSAATARSREGAARAPMVTRAELAMLLCVSERHIAVIERTFPPGSVKRFGRAVRYDAELILDACDRQGAQEQPADTSSDVHSGAAWIQRRMAVRVLPGGKK